MEEEGSAEAARRAPLLGQRPARGVHVSDWLRSPSQFFLLPFCMSCFFVFCFINILSAFPASPPSPLSLSLSLSHSLFLSNTHGHLSLLVSLHLSSSPSLALARTLSACRVFVSGAPAPAVPRLLLALAVLQALSEVGDCGRGMCRWLYVAWSPTLSVRVVLFIYLVPFAVR